MPIIHMHVNESTIFKDKRSSKFTVSCEQADCPLLAKGQCIALTYNNRCIYQKKEIALGYTPKASKAKAWVADAKREADLYPTLGPADEKITFIGDYVWLPYTHMNHIDGKEAGLKFHSYSGAFMSNSFSFMPKDEFTVDTIIKLVLFRPRSLMGDVIDLREQVAKFVKDLSEVCPDLYQAAVERLPRLVEYVDGFNPHFTVAQLQSIGETVDVLYQERKAEYTPYNSLLEIHINSSELTFAADGCRHTLTFEPTPETMLAVTNDKTVIRFREKLRKKG